MTSRRILRLTGTDVDTFLQGLVTNDVADQGLVYAALLTPQGKYIADFFLLRDEDGGVLLDVDETLADMLVKRLNMYKLRADVTIADAGLNLQRGTGDAPVNGLADPRHADMGWRAYSTVPASDDGTDWDAIRVAHCIPETGIELSSDSFILEVGFETLHGVDFRKGCYVGQEVTARMKHKTTLRKGLRVVTIDGIAPVGSEITAKGKPVGTLFTQSGGQAIAYLRLDRAGDGMVANGVSIQLN
ncbi:MAG: folate-binding protein YgfZ [Rhodobacteraceae bacterium]|nr:folate-binding protein YgfZ [Paracoccaceae bacterium]